MLPKVDGLRRHANRAVESGEVREEALQFADAAGADLKHAEGPPCWLVPVTISASPSPVRSTLPAYTPSQSTGLTFSNGVTCAATDRTRKSLRG